ncbi:hypothetical protein R6Q57_008575 [Mikania cordata]
MVHQLKAFFLLAVQRSLMFSTINNDDLIKFEKIFGPKELFKTMKNYKLHIQIICINTKAQIQLQRKAVRLVEISLLMLEGCA